MNCANNDIIVDKLNSEIEYKKKELLKKKAYLSNLVTKNELLKDVVNDYNYYYDNIKEKKQEQYNALAIISEYLDKMSENINITNNTLNEIKYDQKALLNLMNIIRKEIDNLT